MTITRTQFEAALSDCFNDLRHTQFIIASIEELAMIEALLSDDGTVTLPADMIGKTVRLDYAPTLFYGHSRGRAQWFNLHRGFEPERIPRSLGHRPAARRLFGFSPVQRRQTKRRRYLARLRRA